MCVDVKPTCVVLIALGGFTQQLGYSWADSLGAGTQILGAFLKLSNMARRYDIWKKNCYSFCYIHFFIWLCGYLGTEANEATRKIQPSEEKGLSVFVCVWVCVRYHCREDTLVLC